MKNQARKFAVVTLGMFLFVGGGAYVAKANAAASHNWTEVFVANSEKETKESKEKDPPEPKPRESDRPSRTS